MTARARGGRTIRRLLTVFVPIAIVALALALTASSATSAAPAKKQQAVFRQQFSTYLVQMQRVAVKLEASQQGKAGLRSLGVMPSKNLAQARRNVKTMSPSEIAVFQRAFAAYPSWRTMPTRLSPLVNRLKAGSQRSLLITPDDCATARAAGYTQTDVEIAADVALAADAVLEAIPNDVIGEVARIAAVAVWAVPQGVLRGFEHLYNIASACDDADHQALVQTNLDVKVSTRATQTSVDNLTNTLNALNTLVTNNLDVKVSTRASQASLDVFHNEFSANAILVNTKLDTITTKVDTLTNIVNANQALNLRIMIETALSQYDTPTHQVALFELPSAQGGFLELVRSIVADTITKMQATGQPIGSAQTYLGYGDTAMAAHQYKLAYTRFSTAYRQAAN
jgi:hypothetical protein